MDENISKKLQITSQLFISIAIFFVVAVASIAQLYILSASLNLQLQDKAQIVARTLEIGIRESGMIELEDEIQQKLDNLRKIRPDIIEVDVVIPDESSDLKYRMLASTGHSGDYETPDGVDIKVIVTNQEHTMLEIIDRESGEDIIEMHADHIGFKDVMQALFSKENIYVWEIIEPLQNSSGQAIGSIAIEISMDEALQRIEHSIINTSKVFVGALVVMLIIVWLGQRIFFVQPMNKLNKGIELAKAGDFTHQLDIERNDEFGLLAKKYNSMIASLKESREEVNLLNQSLQQKVDKATGELKSSNQLLSEKLNELKKTQQKLIRSERYTASALMAAGVAHEIRNPLHAIKVVNNKMQNKYIDREATETPEYKELNSIFLKQVGHLESLMLDFLDYTRPLKLRLTRCKVEKIIHDALNLSIMDVSSDSVEIVEKYEKDIPKILIDEEVMKKAFMNIINNSLQAMPDGGLLCVEAMKADNGNAVDLLIRDTGIGIEEHNLSEIFEPFRSNHARSVGLGLAIVHRTIEAHAGNISVKSEVDKGTVFHIHLTRAPVIA